MALQSLVDASQKHWDDALARLLNLSSVTLKRQVELEARLEELEHELAVWKTAHASSLELRERDSKAHNMQIAALNNQISNMDLFSKRNQPPLILCVINGTQALFNPTLIVQGQNGGRAAAQALTKAIAGHLASQLSSSLTRLSYWVTIYLNKSQVANLLLASNMIHNHDQFEAFLTGFSQESPRFLIIDVGKEGTEKIKEYIDTYIRFPQTLRIFLGGYQDVEYASTFSELDKDQLLGKLVLIQGPSDLNELSSYAIPYLNASDLFINQQLISRIPKKANTSSFVTTNGGLASPQSPPRNRIRQLDPSLPLHKRESPPPCNEHYLMTCSKAGACKYAHDYVLTPDQLALLASNAKKAPCNWLKNGLSSAYRLV